MRFERKFLLNQGQSFSFDAFIKGYGYQKAFPDRSITSIYYENPEYDLYLDSENGYSERFKIRVRFYNSDIKNKKIEFKNKNAELGWKNYLALTNDIKDSILMNINYTKNLKLRIPLKIRKIYFPNVLVKYDRKYYTSFCQNIRVTIDTNIKFSLIKSDSINASANFFINSTEDIIEIKYNKEIYPDYKLLSAITDRFQLCQ